MSMICTILVNLGNRDAVYAQLTEEAINSGWAVLFDNPTCLKSGGESIIDLCDTFNYVNCEALLLQDSCIKEGSKLAPFSERVTFICRMVKICLTDSPVAILCIGDDPAFPSDFTDLRCNISDLKSVILNNCPPGWFMPNLRISVRRM
ncbi:MAG: hypothetical protein J1E60_05195 [Christensenellaceae bacterium]|nr:hypothetical protein [Christensenellaceae bacterium]